MLCEPVFQRPRDYETVIVSQGVAIQRQNSHLSLKQEKKKSHQASQSGHCKSLERQESCTAVQCCMK